MDLYLILLYLHILGAIVAFGPGFASMIVGPMVAKEPEHANFYARTQLATNRRMVVPVSITMAITGIALIVNRGWGNITAGKHWLELGILLYVIALVIAMAFMAPAGRRLVELTSQPPSPGGGPSPELRSTVARVRTGGMVMGLLVVVIAFLMVAKPF